MAANAISNLHRNPIVNGIRIAVVICGVLLAALFVDRIFFAGAHAQVNFFAPVPAAVSLARSEIPGHYATCGGARRSRGAHGTCRGRCAARVHPRVLGERCGSSDRGQLAGAGGNLRPQHGGDLRRGVHPVRSGPRVERAREGARRCPTQLRDLQSDRSAGAGAGAVGGGRGPAGVTAPVPRRVRCRRSRCTSPRRTRRCRTCCPRGPGPTASPLQTGRPGS